jgi:hypothetical protein
MCDFLKITGPNREDMQGTVNSAREKVETEG